MMNLIALLLALVGFLGISGGDESSDTGSLSFNSGTSSYNGGSTAKGSIEL